MTIEFCLGVLQDFLFDGICDQLRAEQLNRIKGILLETKALYVLQDFRFELQLILTFFCVDEEDELKQVVVLDETLVADHLMPMLRSFKDAGELKLMLKKLKCLTVIAENRQLFRKFGILPCLGTVLEQYTDSDMESVIAEVIHLLLSDKSDTEVEEEDMNPIAIFEEFMAVSLQGWCSIMHGL